MPKFQVRDYPQILQRLIARTVARSNLSDLTQASAVRHILGAVAREVDDVYYQLTRLSNVFSIDTASGQDLDERAQDIQPGTLTRLGAARATGTIVFARATNTGTTITIPRNTLAQTAAGVQVRTTEEAIISAASPEQIPGHGLGRDSNVVPAVAAEVGAAGNVASGTVTSFVSQPPGVNEVRNVSAFTGGRDRETDDEFRERLKNFVTALARSTVGALEFVAIGVEDPTPLSAKVVRASHVFEDPIDRGNVVLYIDDGAGTAKSQQEISLVAGTGPEVVTAGLAGPPVDTAVGGEEYLFLDNAPVDISADAPTPFVLTSSTRGVLTNGVEYYPNPANGKIFFEPALTASEEITAEYTYYDGLIQEVQKVVDGDPNDRANYPGWRAAGVRVLVLTPIILQVEVEGVLTIVEGVDRMTALANAEAAVSTYVNNLGISGDVIRNEIIERIMSVAGVVDVELAKPAGNLVALDDELYRIGLISLR